MSDPKTTKEIRAMMIELGAGEATTEPILAVCAHLDAQSAGLAEVRRQISGERFTVPAPGAAVDLAFQAPDLLRLLRCDKCAADVLHRARLSPAAGTVWRCSQCGETHDTLATFGGPVPTKDAPAARRMTEHERAQFPSDEDWSWLCLPCCRITGTEQMIDGANRDCHKVCRFCGVTPRPPKNAPAFNAQRYDSTAELNHDGSPFGVMTPTPTGQYVHQSALREALRRLEMTDGWNADLAKRLDGAEATIKIMEAGTRRDQAALKAPAPEPTAVEPLPDAPVPRDMDKIIPGGWSNEYVQKLEEHAAEVTRIAEGRGRTIESLKGRMRLANNGKENAEAMRDAGELHDSLDLLGVGQMQDEIESLKAQLAAKLAPAPAPQSPDPWGAKCESVAKYHEEHAGHGGASQEFHERALTILHDAAHLEAARAADQATITDRDAAIVHLRDIYNQASMSCETWSEELAAAQKTIAKRDAKITRLREELTSRVVEMADAKSAEMVGEAIQTAETMIERRTEERDASRERADTNDALLHMEWKLRVGTASERDVGRATIATQATEIERLKEEMDEFAHLGQDLVSSMQKERDGERKRADDAEADLQESDGIRIRLGAMLDNMGVCGQRFGDGKVCGLTPHGDISHMEMPVDKDFREMKSKRDGERTAREVVEGRCADLMRERDEALAVASGQVSLNLELEERVRVLEVALVSLREPAEQAELSANATAQLLGMAVTEALEVLDTTQPDDPPAEEPTEAQKLAQSIRAAGKRVPLGGHVSIRGDVPISGHNLAEHCARVVEDAACDRDLLARFYDPPAEEWKITGSPYDPPDQHGNENTTCACGECCGRCRWIKSKCVCESAEEKDRRVSSKPQTAEQRLNQCPIESCEFCPTDAFNKCQSGGGR